MPGITKKPQKVTKTKPFSKALEGNQTFQNLRATPGEKVNALE